MQERVERVLATDILPEVVSNYGTEVVLDRAIPDVRDGLKPVQRKILYTMYKNKRTSKAKHIKQANISGRVLELHPHGDAAISYSMSLMSQPWNQRVPLIDMMGNNGSIDGDNPAAARYVEVRLSEPAEYLLHDLDKEVVDFKPSYDNETVEPEVLPAKWPVLFTNGAFGIGYGFSTAILPHNPVELLKGVELLNRNPDATLSDVMRFVKGPDFPTGGVVIGREGVLDVYRTGKGRITLRGKAEIQGQKIIITELPYEEKMRKKDVFDSMIQAIVDAKADHQIKDMYDDSEGDGVHIVIELKKGHDPEAILALLYKSSRLEIYYNANHVVIQDEKPVTLGLVDYLQSFLAFRKETLRRFYRYEWDRLSARKHLVEGYLKLADVAVEVVQMIQSSAGRVEVIARLVSEFDFSSKQAKAIADMALHRISKQDIEKLEAERLAIQEKLDDLYKIATDDTYFREKVSEDLKETMSHFSDVKRKTQLEREVEVIEVDETDFIKPELNYVVAKERSIQRMSEVMFSNHIDKYKELIVGYEEADTRDYTLFFTRDGYTIQRQLLDLEYLTLSQDSEDLQRTVLSFKSQDAIIGMKTLSDIETTPYEILSVTKQGQFKRSPLKDQFLSFNNKGYLTRTKVYNGLKLDGDEVIYLLIEKPEVLDQLSFVLSRDSKRGRGTTFDVSTLRRQGPNGSGVNALKMKDGEALVIEEIIGLNSTSLDVPDMVE